MWKSATLGGWKRTGILRSATTSSISRVGVLCSFSPLRPSSRTSRVSSRSILPASRDRVVLGEADELAGILLHDPGDLLVRLLVGGVLDREDDGLVDPRLLRMAQGHLGVGEGGPRGIHRLALPGVTVGVDHQVCLLRVVLATHPARNRTRTRHFRVQGRWRGNRGGAWSSLLKPVRVDPGSVGAHSTARRHRNPDDPPGRASNGAPRRGGYFADPRWLTTLFVVS